MKELELGGPSKSEIMSTLEILMSNIQGPEGVHPIMSHVKGCIDESTMAQKLIALDVIDLFFRSARDIVDEYLQQWLVQLIGFLGDDSDPEIPKASWNALDSLTKRIKKDEMDRYIPQIRKGINEATMGLAMHEEIQGFNLPKVIDFHFRVFLLFYLCFYRVSCTVM